MARRRMFSLDIVDSDQFTDLPPMARLLYYELGVRADDDGFIGNPKKVTRFAECSEDDIKILEEHGFIFKFDSGVLVIRHWNVNNQLRNDRYHETFYKEEKNKLYKNDNNTYCLIEKDGLPNGIQLVALDKNSIRKNSVEENSEAKFIKAEDRKEKSNCFVNNDEFDIDSIF